MKHKIREIKFRAKDTIYDKWLYSNGYYFDGINYWFTFPNSEPDTSKGIAFANHQTIKVETLGQFTGLKDEDNKEIYEGDILRCNGGAADFYFVVGFDHARFTAKVDWLEDKEIDDFGYPPLMAYIGWKFIPEYSVVGNIYENFELLKKK